VPKDIIEAALGGPVMVTIPYTPDRFVEAINYGQPLISSEPDEPIGGLMEDLAFFLAGMLIKNPVQRSPLNPGSVSINAIL
jgi:MinD-like ATPase involved in chromosome partitioning or flagellar assembly